MARGSALMAVSCLKYAINNAKKISKEYERGIKMNLRKFLLASLFALILTIGVACSSDSSTNDGDGEENAGGDPDVTLKLGHVGSDVHQYHIASEKFKEIVEEKSDNSIAIEIHSNATLGSEAEVVEQVIDGTVEMTTVAPDSSFANTVKEMNVFGIPYLFEDADHVYGVLDGEIGNELLDLVDGHNMKGLGWWEIGFRHITNDTREISTPEDMKGLKIRVQPAPVWEAHMEALGASPTPVDFNELYSALDQGLVDGQENPLPSIDSMKFYEVQEYTSLTAHTYSPAITVINQGVWEGLTEEQQQIIQDAVDETRDYIRETLAEMEEEILQTFVDHDIVVTEPDRDLFREKTKDVREHVPEVPEDLIDRIIDAN